MPVLAAMLWEWKSKWGRHGTLILCATIAILALLLYPRDLISSFVNNHYSFSRHYRSANQDPVHGVQASENVADYLMRKIGDNDTVEVSSPGVQWRLDRPQATRYTRFTPLFWKRLDGSFTAYQQKWQSDYIARILQIRPKYYVVEDTIGRDGRLSSPVQLFAIPGLQHLLDENYYLDTAIGIYYLYRRK